MAHPIRMPKPGQMTESCLLVEWHKAPGDPVRRGDVLFEIETDKAVMDVEAFDDGVLLRRVVEAGEAVPVNTICGYVGEAGEAVTDEDLARDRAATVGPTPTATTTRTPAAMASVEPVPVPMPASPPAPPVEGARAPRLAISPRAASLAASAGLDPVSIRGSGPGGRVTERDVQAAIDVAATDVAATARPASAPSPPPGPAGTSEDEAAPRPLGRMRRVIAERLAWSASTIPHFSVTVAVDMSACLAVRRELAVTGVEVGLTDLILWATAQTLAEFPELNSRTDGTSVWLRRRVHLGLAVAVPDGLVVVAIRDADRLSLAWLHERATTLAAAAREGTLTPDDLTGSTFTVSNLGMYGVDEFRAIINPGEAGILAVSSVRPTPVAIGEGIAVRPLMNLTLSADHRLVDGELAARFLNAIRRRLGDLEALRREALGG